MRPTITGFSDEISQSLATQMEMLKLLNIEYIEMRGVNGKNIVHHSLDEAKEVKKQLDHNGFRLSAVGSPIGKVDVNAPFEPHLDLFKHTLEVSAVLEAPFIRMFSFFIPEGDDPEVYRDEVLDRWQAFIRAAEGYDLVLLHENEKEIYGDTAIRCADLLNTLNSDKAGAIFDPANFIQCGVETWPSAYRLLKEQIRYFHIKDAKSSTGQVVPAGYGDGHLKEIIQDIVTAGFNGFLSLEPHLGQYNDSYVFDDTSIAPLPDGGPYKFHVAADALRKLLKEIAIPTA